MREELKEVMVERLIYIAEDGKEFRDRKECINYENSEVLKLERKCENCAYYFEGGEYNEGCDHLGNYQHNWCHSGNRSLHDWKGAGYASNVGK